MEESKAEAQDTEKAHHTGEYIGEPQYPGEPHHTGEAHHTEAELYAAESKAAELAVAGARPKELKPAEQRVIYWRTTWIKEVENKLDIPIVEAANSKEADSRAKLIAALEDATVEADLELAEVGARRLAETKLNVTV